MAQLPTIVFAPSPAPESGTVIVLAGDGGALSAEGRLSANVLIAMPFAIVAFLLVANPSYLARFTESALGYGLVALSVVMLVIGWLWMRKVTRFTF